MIEVYGKNDLKQLITKVPGDPSSAAFFTALTLLNENSSIKIINVCLNKTRIGFIIKKTRSKIKFKNLYMENNEPRGDTC